MKELKRKDVNATKEGGDIIKGHQMVKYPLCLAEHKI